MNTLCYGWWDSPTPQSLLAEVANDAPSLFLHNLLAGLEERIIARLVDYYGAEYGHYLWEWSYDVEDDDELREAVNRAWLTNWSRLRGHVARRDAAEIAALLNERAA